ncbi:L,D-transpeptidase family protein [Sphingomonas piscis]|uniref:L,D-transpeptidase family protein n=1 Tax=Sphingomonas piscis TaxID=2714943 RepID=A0A6G7YM49_9SPHN|nr:L,D-transpeptidase family protein [Sphingomonas piscis]QIK77825.1 L,D-transpeptidase family protein [Sphingomonas piscis]
MRLKVALALLCSAALASCSTTEVPRVQQVAVAPTKKADLGYRWTNGFAEKAREGATSSFGLTHLKPGDFLWTPHIPAEGDTQVVVDLLTQTAFVYRGEQVVGMTTISSGKKGKETPLGFWKVERKQRTYRSRKYQNAPMPFAQIIDDHGIALHGGALPGYPASHGCVRLPIKFAEKLFSLTEVGTKVIVEG